MHRRTLRPLPDLPCKAVVAFPGASGPSRALARQFDWNVLRAAYHDRASIGVGAAYDRFQNQKEFLRKHGRCLVWSVPATDG